MRMLPQMVHNEFRGRGGQHALNTIMAASQPSVHANSLKFKWAAPELVEGATTGRGAAGKRSLPLESQFQGGGPCVVGQATVCRCEASFAGPTIACTAVHSTPAKKVKGGWSCCGVSSLVGYRCKKGAEARLSVCRGWAGGARQEGRRGRGGQERARRQQERHRAQGRRSCGLLRGPPRRCGAVLHCPDSASLVAEDQDAPCALLPPVNITTVLL